METELVVETRNLVKIYGDGDAIHALDGVSFTVRKGEFLSIIGPSGSGKSTLLNLLGALDRPTSGEVIINGENLSKIHNLDAFRSHSVGFVFQTHNLIPTLTARENIEVPMFGVVGNPFKRHARANELLTLIGLEKRGSHLPNQLSGGERQRVAIARALANRPAILLADEPTGNLDSQNTQEFIKLMSELNTAQGTTFIIVTHNHEVARITKRVITLRDGKIQQDVAIKNVYDSDLMDLKNSSLGQAIISGENIPPGFSEIASQLKELMNRI